MAGLSTFAVAAGQGTQPGVTDPAPRPGIQPSQPGQEPERPRQGPRRMMRGEQAVQISEERQPLAPLAGLWEIEATINVGQGEPVTERAQAMRRWVLNGAFLQEMHMPADEVGIGGGRARAESRLPGIGFFGYDQEQSKFNAAWLDASTGGIYSTQGTYDESSKTFTYTATDPTSGGAVREGERVTVTIRVESEDRHVVEMHKGERGQGEPVYRIVYTRAGGPDMLRPEGARPRGGDLDNAPAEERRPMTPPRPAEPPRPGGDQPPR